MNPLVVALNPSVDVEWNVEGVRWEEKNNVLAERRWPGGKGVNVARWLKFLGAQPTLLIPLGGDTGKEMATGLRREKIASSIVPLREATRANIIVTTKKQGQLRFNPAGPTIHSKEWEKIVSAVATWCRRLARQRKTGRGTSGVLVLSGSSPRGVPVDAYGRLIELAHDFGVPAILDCDGPAFARAVKAKPFLVKPNEHELAQWIGQPIKKRTGLTSAARRLSAATGGWVLVSLGGNGGLLLREAENQVVFAKAPKVRALNTVGAGDALLAGAILEIMKGAPPQAWLQRGVQTGSAAVGCRAGQLPRG